MVAPTYFLNFPAAPATYTLSLHDALPIWLKRGRRGDAEFEFKLGRRPHPRDWHVASPITDERHDFAPNPSALFLERENIRRSEEHTSELQSRGHLVCRLLLEKKQSSRWQT